MEQDLQSHQRDLQKNKHTPFFKSVLPSELNDRFMWGNCTQTYIACTNQEYRIKIPSYIFALTQKKKKISILHKQLVFSIYYSLYNETIFKAHFELEVVTPEKRLKPLKLWKSCIKVNIWTETVSNAMHICTLPLFLQQIRKQVLGHIMLNDAQCVKTWAWTIRRIRELL